MSIALFALIGVQINAGLAYWLCFSAYCLFKALKFGIDIIKGYKKENK